MELGAAVSHFSRSVFAGIFCTSAVQIPVLLENKSDLVCFSFLPGCRFLVSVILIPWCHSAALTVCSSLCTLQWYLVDDVLLLHCERSHGFSCSGCGNTAVASFSPKLKWFTCSNMLQAKQRGSKLRLSNVWRNLPDADTLQQAGCYWPAHI